MADTAPRGRARRTVTIALDVAGALALAMTGGVVYFQVAGWLPAGLADTRTSNVWFDADVPYRLQSMVEGGGWATGGAHPLFPGIGRLLLSAVSSSGSSDAWASARFALAACGGLWLALTWALLRLLGIARLDALLFGGLGLFSAGALFWFVVPESFSLSAPGVTLALLAAAASAPPALALAAAAAASAASVLSSGAVGVMAVLGHHLRPREWTKALVTGLLAFAVLSGAWAVQEWSRTTPFFLGARLAEYEQHLFRVTPERLGEVVPGLLCGSMVAPELRNQTPSFRRQALRPAGPAGALAAILWLVLLAAGAAAVLRAAIRGVGRPFAVAALGGIVVLLAVHATLGREMFLYAMSFVPLLLPVAAQAVRFERWRRWVRITAAVLLAAAAFNNLGQLARAAEAAHGIVARRAGSPAAP